MPDGLFSPARFPRARGDRPRRRLCERGPDLVSPRSRGSTRVPSRPRTSPLGFPALAGIDLRCWRRTSLEPWFPRARGDRPQAEQRHGYGNLVSPRSRGSTRPQMVVDPAVHGFPALAGIDPAGWRRSGVDRRFPRARGDRPFTDGATGGGVSVSPRSRGSTLDGDGLPDDQSGFPALAGIDPRRRTG